VYKKYSTKGYVESLIQHEASVFASKHVHPPECCIFGTHKQKRCFKWYIVLLGTSWSSITDDHKYWLTQTTVVFGDQVISKCSNDQFLTVEPTFSISLQLAIILAIYNVTHMISCAVFAWSDCQMVSKCLYNLFLAIEQIYRHV